MFSNLSEFDLILPPHWSAPAVILLVAIIAGLCVFWSRPARATVRRPLYLLLTGLELLAAVMVVLWLINPRVRYARAKALEGDVAILVDASLSMSTTDAPGGRSRHDEARRLVRSREGPLRRALAGKANPRDFSFGDRLTEQTPAQGADQDPATARRTDLAAALEQLATATQGRPLLGVVIATDGADNAAGPIWDAAAKLQAPIYPIGIGRKQPQGATWRNVGLERVEIPTRISANQEIEFKLHLIQEGFTNANLPIQLSRDNEALASETATLAPRRRQSVPIRFTPRHAGTQTYNLKIPNQNGDPFEDDNELEFSVLVVHDQVRVLYSEGALRWIYKYLRRVLAGDESIEFDGVIRTGGGKFYHQGGSDLDLRGSLPARFEQLKGFDVIVFGDIPRDLAAAETLDHLERFVKGEKGGLLIVAGPNNLSDEQYRQTPLARLLPAKLGPGEIVKPRTVERLDLHVTNAGRAAPFVDDLERFAAQVTPRRYYPLASLKSGSEIWLKGRAEGRTEPILVTHRYGNGRVMLLATDDLWTAELAGSANADESAPADLWLQAARWLAHREDEGDEETPHDGRFEIRLDARRGDEASEVRCRVNVGRPHRESIHKELNEDLLRELARQTGGGYYTPLNAEDIAQAIERDQAMTGEIVEHEWVESFWVYLIFCAIVSTEWIIRRRRNLI